MNEGYGAVSYVFHVQSVEDFHNQLTHRADTIIDSYECGDDLGLAQTMLEHIGVDCARH